MLVTIATFAVDPSDADEARAALDTLVAASREDAGCLAYEFLESIEQPGRFRSIEEWDEQASLDDHMAQPHVATAIEQLTPRLVSELEIVTHVVAD